ncbi:transcriptional regulator [Actinorhabdospora filicis]|uniref:Transcriptional regulator n=2 Tax=Actinorhabdospora filicis TaxID=1785913 RepID=A0A9W6W654_9ACTN|nr:transcriptional regulator [Actinorhabdospora filicis]
MEYGMDDIDRRLIAELQRDASASYATLAAAVGLSTASAHDRVRKLKERGIIRRTTVEVDPAALGRGVLSYVLIDANAWMGDASTGDALAALPEVEEAHIIAGAGTLLVKVRTATTQDLQGVLRRLYEVPGVASTQSIVVLETFFERPVSPTA